MKILHKIIIYILIINMFFSPIAFAEPSSSETTTGNTATNTAAPAEEDNLVVSEDSTENVDYTGFHSLMKEIGVQPDSYDEKAKGILRESVTSENMVLQPGGEDAIVQMYTLEDTSMSDIFGTTDFSSYSISDNQDLTPDIIEKLKQFLLQRNSFFVTTDGTSINQGNVSAYFDVIMQVSKEQKIDPILLFAITGNEQSYVKNDLQYWKSRYGGADALRARLDKIRLHATLKDTMSIMANNPFNVRHSWWEYNEPSTNIRKSTEMACDTLKKWENYPIEGDVLDRIGSKYAEDGSWALNVKGIYRTIMNKCGLSTTFMGDEDLSSLQGPIGPMQWPVPGNITRISSPFGWRTCPFHGREFHEAIDIAASTGTPIYAVADGIVSTAEYKSSYGNQTMIKHGGGFVTVYNHQSVIGVRRGQKVTKGQVIGKVGSTGNSTGAHLDFRVQVNGKYKNPMGFSMERVK